MIKKLGLILLLSVAVFAMDYKLKPKRISNSVYMFTGHNEIVTAKNGGNIANTYWVNTSKHWVVIDSGASYAYALQAHEAMKKIANLPIKLVINTHMHDDHWMGNSYYKELNIPLYATKLQVETFKVGGSTRILHTLNKEDAKGTKIVSIDNIITANQTLNVDGYEFEITILEKPAHTKQDIFIYMKKEKVLFSGDLLFSQRVTSIRDGSIEGSLNSLKVMHAKDVKTWANGHGKYTDLTAYNHMTSYLSDLKKLALQAVEDEVELDEFVKTADMSKYKDMKLFDRLSKANLDSAFREYEFFEEE